MQIFCDGSYFSQLSGKVGRASFSSFVAMRGKTKVKSMCFPVDAVNSFEAEFIAVIHAMQWAILNGIRLVVIASDSQSMIQMLNGEVKKFNPRYEKHVQLILHLVSQFSDIKFVWVPRKENKVADRLCRDLSKVTAALSEIYWVANRQVTNLALTKSFPGL